MHILMSLWCSDVSAGREMIGTFIYGFLWCFIPPYSKGLAGSYMWSALNEYLVVIVQLRLISSRRYALKLDVTVQ